MSSRSTIAERIAKFRSAPPAPRHVRETSAEPKQFWWQTASGGSRKHLRGAGEDVGQESSRDQDASASKRRSIAGPSDRGQRMPGSGGRDQVASSSSRQPTSSIAASTPAAAHSSGRNTVPVTNTRAPMTSSHLMSRGALTSSLAPNTASSSMAFHAHHATASDFAAGQQGHSRVAAAGSGGNLVGEAGLERSGSYALGGMPEGGSREAVAGEALQVLDQLACTNPSLYAALSAIDESAPAPEGDLSEEMLARIQALLGPPSSFAGAAVGGGRGGGARSRASPSDLSDQGHKMRGGAPRPGGLMPVREVNEEEDGEGEESLQAALNRYRAPGGTNPTAAAPSKTLPAARAAVMAEAIPQDLARSLGLTTASHAQASDQPNLQTQQQQQQQQQQQAMPQHEAVPQQQRQQQQQRAVSGASHSSNRPSTSSADSFSFAPLPPPQPSTHAQHPHFGPVFKPKPPYRDPAANDASGLTPSAPFKEPKASSSSSSSSKSNATLASEAQGTRARSGLGAADTPAHSTAPTTATSARGAAPPTASSQAHATPAAPPQSNATQQHPASTQGAPALALSGRAIAPSASAAEAAAAPPAAPTDKPEHQRAQEPGAQRQGVMVADTVAQGARPATAPSVAHEKADTKASSTPVVAPDALQVSSDQAKPPAAAASLRPDQGAPTSIRQSQGGAASVPPSQRAKTPAGASMRPGQGGAARPTPSQGAKMPAVLQASDQARRQAAAAAALAAAMAPHDDQAAPESAHDRKAAESARGHAAAGSAHASRPRSAAHSVVASSAAPASASRPASHAASSATSAAPQPPPAAPTTGDSGAQLREQLPSASTGATGHAHSTHSVMPSQASAAPIAGEGGAHSRERPPAASAVGATGHAHSAHGTSPSQAPAAASARPASAREAATARLGPSQTAAAAVAHSAPPAGTTATAHSEPLAGPAAAAAGHSQAHAMSAPTAGRRMDGGTDGVHAYAAPQSSSSLRASSGSSSSSRSKKGPAEAPADAAGGMRVRSSSSGGGDGGEGDAMMLLPFQPPPVVDVSKGWPAHLPHGTPILLPGPDGSSPAAMFVPLSPPKRHSASPSPPSSRPSSPITHHAPSTPQEAYHYHPHPGSQHPEHRPASQGSAVNGMPMGPTHLFVPAELGQHPQLLAIPGHPSHPMPAPASPPRVPHIPAAAHARQSGAYSQISEQQQQLQPCHHHHHHDCSPQHSLGEQEQPKEEGSVRPQQQQAGWWSDTADPGAGVPYGGDWQQHAAPQSSSSSSGGSRSSSKSVSSKSSFAFQPPGATPLSLASTQSHAPQAQKSDSGPQTLSKARKSQRSAQSQPHGPQRSGLGPQAPSEAHISHRSPAPSTDQAKGVLNGGVGLSTEQLGTQSTDQIRPHLGVHHGDVGPSKQQHGAHPEAPAQRRVCEEEQLLTSNPRKLTAFQAKERRRAERCGGYDFHEEGPAAAAKDKGTARARAAAPAPAPAAAAAAESRSRTDAAGEAGAGTGAAQQDHAVSGEQATSAALACTAGADVQGDNGSVGHLSEIDAELERSVRAAAEGKTWGADHARCQDTLAQLPRKRITRLVEQVEHTRRSKRENAIRNQEKFKIENMGWDELEGYLGDEAAPVREFRRLKWEMMQLKQAVGSIPPAKLREQFLEKAEAVKGAALEAAVSREVERAAEQERQEEVQAQAARTSMEFQHALATQAHAHTLADAQLRGAAATASAPPLTTTAGSPFSAALPPSPQDDQKLPLGGTQHSTAAGLPAGPQLPQSPTRHHAAQALPPAAAAAAAAHPTAAAAAAAHLARLGLHPDVSNPQWYKSLLSASGSRAAAPTAQDVLPEISAPGAHTVGELGDGTAYLTTTHSLPGRPAGPYASSTRVKGGGSSSSSRSNCSDSGDSSGVESSSSDGGVRWGAKGDRKWKKKEMKKDKGSDSRGAGEGGAQESREKRKRRADTAEATHLQSSQDISDITRAAREVASKLDSAVQDFLANTSSSSGAPPGFPYPFTPHPPSAAAANPRTISSSTLHAAHCPLQPGNPLLSSTLDSRIVQDPSLLPRANLQHPGLRFVDAHPLPDVSATFVAGVRGANAHSDAHPLVLQAQQQAAEAQHMAVQAQQATEQLQQRVQEREREEQQQQQQQQWEIQQRELQLQLQQQQQQQLEVQQREMQQQQQWQQQWETQQHQQQQQLQAPLAGPSDSYQYPSSSPSAALPAAAPAAANLRTFPPLHPEPLLLDNTFPVPQQPAAPAVPAAPHPSEVPALAHLHPLHHSLAAAPAGAVHLSSTAAPIPLTPPIAPSPLFPNWPGLGPVPGEGLPYLLPEQHQHQCQLQGSLPQLLPEQQQHQQQYQQQQHQGHHHQQDQLQESVPQLHYDGQLSHEPQLAAGPAIAQSHHNQQQLEQQRIWGAAQASAQPQQQQQSSESRAQHQPLPTSSTGSDITFYHPPQTTESQAAAAAAAFRVSRTPVPPHSSDHHHRARERHIDILEVEGAHSSSSDSYAASTISSSAAAAAAAGAGAGSNLRPASKPSTPPGLDRSSPPTATAEGQEGLGKNAAPFKEDAYGGAPAGWHHHHHHCQQQQRQHLAAGTHLHRHHHDQQQPRSFPPPAPAPIPPSAPESSYTAQPANQNPTMQPSTYAAQAAGQDVMLQPAAQSRHPHTAPSQPGHTYPPADILYSRPTPTYSAAAPTYPYTHTPPLPPSACTHAPPQAPSTAAYLPPAAAHHAHKAAHPPYPQTSPQALHPQPYSQPSLGPIVHPYTQTAPHPLCMHTSSSASLTQKPPPPPHSFAHAPRAASTCTPWDHHHISHGGMRVPPLPPTSVKAPAGMTLAPAPAGDGRVQRAYQDTWEQVYAVYRR